MFVDFVDIAACVVDMFVDPFGIGRQVLETGYMTAVADHVLAGTAALAAPSADIAAEKFVPFAVDMVSVAEGVDADRFAVDIVVAVVDGGRTAAFAETADIVADNGIATSDNMLLDHGVWAKPAG